jgi:protein-disulfide isomerase
MKSNSETKLLAIMALIVLAGGGFLLLGNKNPVVPTPMTTPAPINWTTTQFDEVFKAAKHTRGNPNSPLQIIEFADTECPSCRRTFHAFSHKLGKEIDANFAYLHYPIPGLGHDHSIPCTTAMEAAHRQSKFWEMHEALFAKQDVEADTTAHPDLSNEFIQKQAEKIGLNMEQFNKDIKDPALMKVGEESEKYALAQKIDQTPTFVYKYQGKVEIAVGAPILLDKLKGYPGLPTNEEFNVKTGVKSAIPPPSL